MSKKVVARICMRERCVTFRLFLRDVTKHADSIASAPEQIRNVFIGESGNGTHCSGNVCRFQKYYAIETAKVEKCNSEVLTFTDASVRKIPDYTDLFKEPYVPRQLSEKRSVKDDCLFISCNEPIKLIIEKYGLK